MWSFLLIKSSQNQLFTIGLYVFVAIYAIHVILMAKVLKVFYLMGRKCDELMEKRQEKLKMTCSEVQEGMEND